VNSQSTNVLFDYFEDLADAHELELILQRPPEEVRAELLADGADLERVRMALAHAMGEGEAPPARTPRTAAPPPTNVVPITRARPDRVLRVMRSISVAVAASFFGLFVWKQGTMRAVEPGHARHQDRELSDGRPVPPAPSVVPDPDLQKAEQLRAEARTLCAQGHWGPCEDKLDQAGILDRAGDETLAVHELRNQIGPGMDEDTGGGASMYAKPGVGPGEVPLRRRHH
jgi:hypothetical protein